jgi:hypothetical protein
MKGGFECSYQTLEKAIHKPYQRLERAIEKSDQRLERAVETLGEQNKEAEARLEARMDRLESRRGRFLSWIGAAVAAAFGALVSHFVER